MRHIYATYYHAQFNDEKELIKQMGHVDDRELKFYRKFGKRIRDRAKEFWNFKLKANEDIQKSPVDLKICIVSIFTRKNNSNL